MDDLYDLHRALAWFLVSSNGAVGLYALAAQYITRLRGVWVWWAIGVAQVSTFAIAIVGVLIVNRYGVELDSFHALYGFTTIIAVGILYSYRSSPFIKNKQYLLYGFGSLFIMGLGIRNFFLG
mgnify:FL=1